MRSGIVTGATMEMFDAAIVSVPMRSGIVTYGAGLVVDGSFGFSSHAFRDCDIFHTTF